MDEIFISNWKYYIIFLFSWNQFYLKFYQNFNNLLNFRMVLGLEKIYKDST